MRRHPLSPLQKLVVAVMIPGGLVIVALGTKGPLQGIWIDGMIPISVLGGVATLAALALLVFGPARPSARPAGPPAGYVRHS